jgi:hypothetical protein
MVNCPLSAKVLRSAHGAWPPDVETSTSELAQRAQVRTGRFIRDRKSRNDPSRVSAFALHKRFLPDVMSYPGRGRKGTAVRKALPSFALEIRQAIQKASRRSLKVQQAHRRYEGIICALHR